MRTSLLEPDAFSCGPGRNVGVPLWKAIRTLWDIRIRINLRKYRKWGMPETSQGRRMER
jgi:hypothetical protein